MNLSGWSKLGEIVAQVESGEEVELTRRGRTIAVVVPVARQAPRPGDPVAFMTAYERFRAQHDLGELGVEPGWATGLRDRGAYTTSTRTRWPGAAARRRSQVRSGAGRTSASAR